MDRVRAEEDSGRLSALLKASQDAIIEVAFDGRVRRWNGAAERMFGYAAAEIVGQPVTRLSPPELLDEHRGLIDQVVQGTQPPVVQTQGRRKDGAVIHLSIGLSPIRDRDGHIVGVAEIVRDITDHKKLEDHIRQKQKLEAVGRLAGGVAHEYNNLLMAIIGYAELALLDTPPSSPARDDILGVLESARRAADLTGRLLAFTRNQSGERTHVRVDDLLRRIDKILSHLIPETIELLTLPSSSGYVLAVPSELEQVLVNLAVNACDAMPGGGELTISADDATVPGDGDGWPAGVAPGDYVRVAVEDTGCGIPEEARERIFEPFFTTKQVGDGVGLGLWVVYNIVRRAGGHIFVTSAPGATRFEVLLPRAAPPPRRPGADPGDGLDRSALTLLLVEDEPAVRKVGAKILRRLGYTVLEAANGEEALRAAERHDGPIQLAITDVVMPVMGGVEFARRFRELHPESEVLLVSGYTGPVDLGGDLPLLRKPYSADSLARKVRELVG